MKVFSNPQKIIQEFELNQGEKVVDLGAGSGFYTLEAAKIVGEDGRVYAVDIQKDLLTKIKDQADKEFLNCIEVVWGDVEKVGGSKLKEASVDVAIASNILFQIEDRETFAMEVWRVLKPQGRLFVVDWTDSFGGLGPEVSKVFGKEEAKRLFTGKSFSFVKDIPVGAHHYGMMFHKPLK